MFRNGNEIDRVVGVDTSAITQKLRKIVESNRSIEQRLVSLINQQQQLPLVVMTPSLRSRWKRNRYDRYSSSDQDEKDETNSSKSNSDCFILYVFVIAFK